MNKLDFMALKCLLLEVIPTFAHTPGNKFYFVKN